MVFGRKKRDKDEAAEAAEETRTSGVVDPENRVIERPDRVPTTGPWDSEDLPEDDERPRIDLGGMRVPMPTDGEVRLEVNPQGQVVSAIAVDKSGQVQMNVFAAPRLDGIWGEVRLEIAQSLKAQGGAAEEIDGPFGRELKARIPNPEQPNQSVPARFIGADGPRWFLRGLITGPAATNPAQAEALHDVFRNVVVVRGDQAMAPRDPLPLTLPKEAQEAAAQAQAQAEAEAAAAQGGGGPGGADGAGGAGAEGDSSRWQDLDPFERGPEITETR